MIAKKLLSTGTGKKPAIAKVGLAVRSIKVMRPNQHFAISASKERVAHTAVSRFPILFADKSDRMSISMAIIALIACAVVTWVYCGLFTVLFAENRRFWKSHQRPAPQQVVYPRVSVIIPCKGVDFRLRENLQAILLQDHPNYEVTFVVERGDDTAVPLIRQLQQENSCLKTQLIIAGRAADRGQKVHNLLAATEKLTNDISILVFADSDASPGTAWLRWLVSSIGRKKLGAKTGYRWMVPQRNNLPTLIAVTVNNTCASMMGRGKRNLIWGGSWAIHRRIFDGVGLEQAWSRSLSDDLVAARALRNAELEIEFEPQCVCTTPVSFDWNTLIEFMRRQFLITRIYAPVWWSLTLAVTAITQAGFWGGLVGGMMLQFAGNPIGKWLVLSSMLLYAVGIIRGSIRQSIGRGNDSQWRKYRVAQKFDLLAGPITGVATLTMLLLSAVGQRITWRGVRYHIARSGDTTLIGRSLPSSIHQPSKDRGSSTHIAKNPASRAA